MRRIALCTALIPVALAARADVVTDWNRIAVPIVTSYGLGAPPYRELAMMHIAMYEAINAFEPRYQPYRHKLEAPTGASKDAAAAVAAVRVLARLHADSAPKLDTPTSVTQIGSVVAARISASLAGHSSICHRFQSSGKPCTATVST